MPGQTDMPCRTQRQADISGTLLVDPIHLDALATFECGGVRVEGRIRKLGSRVQNQGSGFNVRDDGSASVGVTLRVAGQATPSSATSRVAVTSLRQMLP
eukprot:CAMPEP_0119471804 /NCGR_PEP_ID=MMETSP1344-20130328/4122_1 /TAXON_ID=236787 /ORGANISM="Florenciella parvula, Strain CCMP2471" /LENGTH=98 /DNA_ID=CAMNT_0007504643 /DNA_START=318 /DNA_END=610 /DNA_ORIENTATION=-